MRYWFCSLCFIVILIIHIKHLFTLFLNFHIQSTLNCMTSCHGATPTVNSRCTNPTRVHRSWLRVHEVNGTLFHRSWTRDHDFTSSMERSINCVCRSLVTTSFCLIDGYAQSRSFRVFFRFGHCRYLFISKQKWCSYHWVNISQQLLWMAESCTEVRFTQLSVTVIFEHKHFTR